MTASLAACGQQRPDVGPVVVSAIGGPVGYADPARGALTAPARLLLGATAQGLVRFDAAGQIEAGLAERWTVIDGGMTYIFRLAPAKWSDGTPVTAEALVASLKRAIGPGSRNPLAPFLTAIDDVVVMTPQVIEIRLQRPRPDLLRLFAQAEMAIVRDGGSVGSGPMRRVAATGWLLRPIAVAHANPDDPVPRRPEDDVRLFGERAGLAIARFVGHRSDLVAGGTFVDWPLLSASGQISPGSLRTDPAAGLFGLAVVRRDGFLADPIHRAAVAAAIDRAALTGAIDPGWTTTETILPDRLDSASPPAAPPWTTLTREQRLTAAHTVVGSWAGGPIMLAVALPPGPGATLVFGAIAADLARIGIAVRRVAPGTAADLVLIDQVAPYDSARWYLATACRPCAPAAAAALIAARDAPTLAERAAQIAAADRAMAEDVAFIPLARPLRWSLVSPRLGQWQANARAIHPLNRLRPATM